MKNYIGITGIKTTYELHELHKIIQTQSLSQYQIMFGILASRSVLELGAHPTNDRYPPRIIWRELFTYLQQLNPNYFGVIHYNSQTPDFHREVLKILDEINYEKEIVRGVQLNMALPDPDEIKMILDRYPDLEIILQVNRSFNAFESMLCDVLNDKYRMCTHLLFDHSQGTGTECKVQNFQQNLLRCQNDKYFSLGIAGGLGAENVAEFCQKLRTTIYPFSIDAESKLRTQFACTPYFLDLEKCKNYLCQSVQALDR